MVTTIRANLIPLLSRPHFYILLDLDAIVGRKERGYNSWHCNRITKEGGIST